MFDQIKNKIKTKIADVRDKAFTAGPGKVSTLGKLVGAQPLNTAKRAFQIKQEPTPLPIPLPREIKEQARRAQTYPTTSVQPTVKIAPHIITPFKVPPSRVATPTPQRVVAPTATPTPTPMPTPQQWTGHNIQIPASQGSGMNQVPQYAAQALMNAFDDIGEATNAATVLHHPRSQTRTKSEIKRMGESWNHGENASYKTGADATQLDGSIDRGLMRINSNTFNGLMQRHPDWMEKIGVSSWDQMNDPVLNAQVGRLVLLDSNYKKGKVRKNPSYRRWFAAPLGLRER